jgi:prostaglandin-H2 D-isomerase / glutathione transferase
MTAPVPKLHYYNMGGRAAPARLAFVVGGVAFEDIRYDSGEAVDVAAAANPGLLPCGTVPVLQVGDAVISQSRAIAYYAARVAGLLPDDALKMADVDEAYATVDDIVDSVMGTMGKDDLEKVRAEWVETKAKPLLARVQAIYERGSKEGPFLLGATPTVCDFQLAATIGYFASGQLDHVPADLVQANYPRLAAAFGAVMTHPAVAEYLVKNPRM